MKKKPGRAGGRSRSYALVEPKCPVCLDKRVLQLVAELSGVFERVRCPHCGPPHVPISTYFSRGKS